LTAGVFKARLGSSLSGAIFESKLPESDLGGNFMHGSVEPEDRFPPAKAGDAIAKTSQTSAAAAGAAPAMANASRALAETELESALQLLVERAQYITGATGTALALPRGEEMVCRASAGTSAPAVGARLQVRSGLTGESISRRQMLRCNNAETDPRVNLEACRALGIASIVVLPLLRSNGEVRGLFELFSDHPYAFEERDLIALERMADLTLTALDLAEQRPDSAPARRREPQKTVESPRASSTRPTPASRTDIPPKPEFGSRASAETASPVAESPVNQQPAPASVSSVPEAMLRMQKCSSCGFPVSEGRTLCLDCEKRDCEKKDSEKRDFEKKQREQEQPQTEQGQIEQQEITQREQEQDTSSVSASASAADSEVLTPEEIVPAFLINSPPAQKSWLASPVNLLAILVVILGIVVAVVVFR
jgi:putative methionine-R-sulfoxide reductase with GAF domain